MFEPDHGEPPGPEEPAPSLSRGLRVGAYEGLRAGEAIVAVRERGLRPSLERVEGYEAQLHGFVVSQEPAADERVQVESQVFLYIGAPARTIAADGPVGEGFVAQTPLAAGEDRLVAEDEPPFQEGQAPPVALETEVDEELYGQVAPDSVAEAPRRGPTVEFGGLDEGELEVEEDWDGLDEPEELDREPEAVDEPTRVWRGPLLGAVSRRRFVGGTGRRAFEPPGGRTKGRLGAVPVGVKVAAIGLLACAAITLLLSVASRSGGERAGHRSANAGAQQVVAAGAPPAVRRAPRPPVAVAPRRVVPAGRRAARRGNRRRVARRAVRVVVVRVPVATPAVAPVAGAPSAAEVRAAEDAHAEREFGP